MLGAYEGLMRAAPQALRQPAQSMGGTAMPVGWKDTVPVAEKHARDIMTKMQMIRDKYPDPNMDVLPEDAHHMASLEADLKQMIASWEHGQIKGAEQGKFRDMLEGGSRSLDIGGSLFDASKGRIPPPPGTR